MDAVKNFARSTLAAGITSGAALLSVQAGDGTRFPAEPFNATIWNKTDYAAPSDDPDREIVRVTVIATDTFTIVRGQEGTAGVAHNTGGKTYGIIRAFTAKDAMDGGGVTGIKTFAGNQTNLAFASIDLAASGDGVAGVVDFMVILHDTAPTQNATAVRSGGQRFAAARIIGGTNVQATLQAVDVPVVIADNSDLDLANPAATLSVAVVDTVVTFRFSVTSDITISDGTLLWTIREFNGHAVTPV